MKKKYNIFLLSAVIYSVFTLPAKGQYVIKKADAQFEVFNYEKAVELYTEAYQKKKSKKATQRLAECYRLLRDFKQAESWYALLIQMEDVEPEAFKFYGDMLRNNSKYDEAKQQYIKYNRLVKRPTPEVTAQIAKWIVSCDSAVSWMNHPKRIEITNEPTLNTTTSEWAAVVYQNGLVFTSDRNVVAPKVKTKKPTLKFDKYEFPNPEVYGWTGNGYLKLLQRNQEGNIDLFPLKIAGEGFHVGSATFSADGNEVYFTLSRIPSKINRKKNGPSTVNIEIYSSRKNGDSWSEPKSFRYNNVLEWSVGDPFLSADGKQLYFISNMPGGKGGTDIYVCNRTADGNWGAALNLFMVNSIGNERTPFVDGEMMYFSSDAGINMGGLDIFKANSKTGLVVNMGYPINSPQDDFAFILTGKQKGYFSSNRDGGLGSDDIYSFDNMRVPYILLKDQLVNIEDQKPIPNAVITFKKAGGIPLKTQADAEGNYTVRLEEGADYEISIAKTGFRTAVVEVKANDHRDDIKLPHSLVPIVIDLPIKIENIYYDFNQSKIRKDAAVELDKLALLMRQNPTIWIELSSHTDSRGSDQLNMALSTARAEAAVKYLIARGIDKYRIKAVGYGETRLVNNCKNGVWCPIEEHKKNRRTEFTIVKQ